MNDLLCSECSDRLFVYGYYNVHNEGDEQYKETMKPLLVQLGLCDPKTDVLFINFDEDNKKLFNGQEIIRPKDTDVIVLGGGDILNKYTMKHFYERFHDHKGPIYAVSVGIPFISDFVSIVDKLQNVNHFYVRSTYHVPIIEYFFPGRCTFIEDACKFLFGSGPHGHGHNHNPRALHMKRSFKINRTITGGPRNNRPIGISGRDSSSSDSDSDPRRRRRRRRSSNKINVCSLMNLPTNNISTHSFHNEKVVMCLSYSMYDNNNIKPEPTSDVPIIKAFHSLVQYFNNLGFQIVFVPFCTDPEKNDITFHKIVNGNNKGNIVIDRKLTTREVIKYLSDSSLIVSSKFHASLYAYYLNKKFIAISSTNKVKYLLRDIQYTGPKINVSDNLITLNENELYDYIVNGNIRYSNVLESLVKHYKNQVNYRQDKDQTNQNQNQGYISIESRIKKVLDEILSNPTSNSENLAKIVLYHLFHTGPGQLFNNIEYLHGLTEKISNGTFQQNITQECSWLITDYLEKHIYNYYYKNQIPESSNNDKLYNITYIDQHDTSGVHRFGWAYVYDHLVPFSGTHEKLPLLDLYVDRTFHWDSDLMARIGVIPYTRPWYGVIHHTFNTSFSSYNCIELFKNKYFLESLRHCKGLIVLSEYLKKDFQKILDIIPIENYYNHRVPVHVIYHPTELTVPKFRLEKFLKNDDKKLLHIGAWLRDLYSFYTLNIDKPTGCFSGFYNTSTAGTIRLNKCAIKGSHMNNYFPDKNFLGQLHGFLAGNEHEHREYEQSEQSDDEQLFCSTGPNTGPGPYCSRDKIKNNWYQQFYKDTSNKIHSVRVIEKLSNDDYDEILTENIVFLNLIDASAINVLIECMARETPIVINKIPPVIELLGLEYPLYYNSLGQVPGLLTLKKIKQAHHYLKRLDKSPISIHTFMHQIKKIIGPSMIFE
jgi:hypothetical protein